MPQLAGMRTKRLTLPSSTADDPAWVDVNEAIEANTLLQAQSRVTAPEASLVIVALSIVAWNFTDADGNTAEINETNVGKLPASDFRYLDDYLEPLVTEAMSAKVDGELKKS